MTARPSRIPLTFLQSRADYRKATERQNVGKSISNRGVTP